jgi:hypothetical protein
MLIVWNPPTCSHSLLRTRACFGNSFWVIGKKYAPHSLFFIFNLSMSSSHVALSMPSRRGMEKGHRIQYANWSRFMNSWRREVSISLATHFTVILVMTNCIKNLKRHGGLNYGNDMICALFRERCSSCPHLLWSSPYFGKDQVPARFFRCSRAGTWFGIVVAAPDPNSCSASACRFSKYKSDKTAWLTSLTSVLPVHNILHVRRSFWSWVFVLFPGFWWLRRWVTESTQQKLAAAFWRLHFGFFGCTKPYWRVATYCLLCTFE